MKRVIVLAVTVLLSCVSACADPMPGFYVANIRYISGGNRDAYVNIEDSSTKDFKGGSVELQPMGRGAGRPVASGRVPTANDRLMNPSEPIEITANGNSVTFLFDKYQYTGIKLRILDSRGKVLGSMPDEDSRFTLKVSAKPENYYVESEDGGRYRYFLLSIKSGPEVKRNMPSNVDMESARRQLAVFQEIEQEYRRQHSIGEDEELSQSDMQKIYLTVQERLYGKETARQQEIAQEITNAYMKRKGITDPNKLTQKDWENIAQEVAKKLQGDNTQPVKKSTTKRKKSR
ncbi:MAG: hypothetical protein IJR63_03810 [Synergistaceae bacterium]|nr:hypothetical protein [Synergistaceae bacterium]